MCKMSLDTIQQNARSLADALKTYTLYEKGTDEAAALKRRQLQQYILKLAYNIQKCIDEEREQL